MQTAWNGFGLPASNMVFTDVFVPKSLPAVVLNDFPGVVSRVALPTTTHFVALWTAQDEVWYAVDEDPGPIPGLSMGSTIPATAFATGGIVLPGMWHVVAVPDDSLAHTVHLVSAAPSPTVKITAFTEIM